MAEVLIFHHVRGRTSGVREFAEKLRAAGHTVHVPDLFDGQQFDSLDDGMAYVRGVGFDTIVERATATAEGLPAELVYIGISLGVVPAQKLSQTRPGAQGAVLLEACVPAAEFGVWPDGVPVEVHGMDADPFFAGEGDIDAARELVESAAGELVVHPGDRHLFTDSSLSSYDPSAAAQVDRAVLDFLGRLDQPR